MITFKKIAHASVSISKDKFTSLTDPWFGYPINLNTFHLYPPIKPGFTNIIEIGNAGHELGPFKVYCG